MAPEKDTEAKAKPEKKAKPAEKAAVEMPQEVDYGKLIKYLEERVEYLEGNLGHLQDRFSAFLAGLSDNFGKEYVQAFRAEE